MRLAFPLLVADIGGTNARFALLPNADDEAVLLKCVLTSDFSTLADAIRHVLADLPDVRPRAAFLAVAGRVDADGIKLTNCPWSVRPRELMFDIGLDEVALINDFEAQAYAAATIERQFLEPLGIETRPRQETRLIVGPGTGLGVAGLLNIGGKWQPLAGEGGHVDIGPRSRREEEIFAHLYRIEGRVSAEEVLSGRGLLNLYWATCAADGISPRHEEPSKISADGLAGRDVQATLAVSLFATLLGRVAGDLALTFMARGGVFLAGGIAVKLAEALRASHFRQAFEDKAPHSALLRSIPTFIITHPQAALRGLASYARAPEKFADLPAKQCWRSQLEPLSAAVG